jgi:hypothetical protein
MPRSAPGWSLQWVDAFESLLWIVVETQDVDQALLGCRGQVWHHMWHRCKYCSKGMPDTAGPSLGSLAIRSPVMLV